MTDPKPDLGILGDALRQRDSTGPDTPIPFGRRKGTPLKYIDSTYLQWCLDHVPWLAPDHRHLIAREVLRRRPAESGATRSDKTKGAPAVKKSLGDMTEGELQHHLGLIAREIDRALPEGSRFVLLAFDDRPTCQFASNCPRDQIIPALRRVADHLEHQHREDS